MYPASRESAAFGSKAMMGYARSVPNKWVGHEGRFFVPGLPNAVALFRHQVQASKLRRELVTRLLLLGLPEVERTLMGQNHPSNARELVRKRDDNLVSVYPLCLHAAYPDTEMVFGSV